jgi:hypothetical protein
LNTDHIGLPLGAFVGVVSAWFIPDHWTNMQVAALVAAEMRLFGLVTGGSRGAVDSALECLGARDRPLAAVTRRCENHTGADAAGVRLLNLRVRESKLPDRRFSCTDAFSYCELNGSF